MVELDFKDQFDERYSRNWFERVKNGNIVDLI